MENLSLPSERRNYPRYLTDLPFNFQMAESPNIHAGLTVNVSGTGLQIQTMKDMSIGLKLSIEVFFAMGFELSMLEGTVRVIWKNDFDDHVWGKALGYKYGLKFVKISEENDLKLKQLVRNKSNAGDISPHGNEEE